jgi:SAM-dependent methyltransferase
MKRDDGVSHISISVRCIVCQSSEVKALKDYTSPFTEDRYTLYSCGACQSYFFCIEQNPIDLENVYEQYAQGRDGRANGTFQSSMYWRGEVEAIRGLSRRSIHSVLDGGCRTGDFLLHWPTDTRRVGIEISNTWATVARARGLSVLQGFVEDVTIDQEFDVITCYAVIEHLRDPISFLRKVSNAVHKDGIAAVMTPTHECFKQKLLFACGKQWHMYSPPQHLNFLSRKILDETMSCCGLKLIARKYTSGGMFNPFRCIPLCRGAFGRFMYMLDASSPLNCLLIFDHMYSCHVKEQ